MSTCKQLGQLVVHCGFVQRQLSVHRNIVNRQRNHFVVDLGVHLPVDYGELARTTVDFIQRRIA